MGRSFSALLVLILAGCTSVIPARKSSDMVPKPVTTSLPIGVFPLLFNIESGAIVGGSAEDPDGQYHEVFRWNKGFSVRRHAFQNPAREELKENGFVFAVGSKAAYQLKSTIEHMVFNQFPNHSEASVEVTWTFDGHNSLEVRTRGYARVEARGPEALYRAYRTSLRNLLARDDILERFAPKGLPVRSAAAEPVGDLAAPAGDPTKQPPEQPPEPRRPTAVDRAVPRVPSADSALTEDALDSRVRRGVVTLLARDRWSSGVVVDNNGLVITSAYLVAGVAYVNLVLHDGTTRAAKVLLVDKAAGLALVRSVSSGGFVPLPLREDSPGPGTPVTAYGTPYHPALSISTARGKLIGSTGVHLATDLQVVAGNAGGPIVDDRGRVVGIIMWTRERSTGTARARCVPVKEALKSLRLRLE